VGKHGPVLVHYYDGDSLASEFYVPAFGNTVPSS